MTAAVPLWMSLSVVIVPFYILFISTDLTSGLLTNGIAFAILMLYLMKVPGRVRENFGEAPEPGVGDPSCDSNAECRHATS